MRAAAAVSSVPVTTCQNGDGCNTKRREADKQLARTYVINLTISNLPKYTVTR
jgi:hypothetical protein